MSLTRGTRVLEQPSENYFKSRVDPLSNRQLQEQDGGKGGGRVWSRSSVL
jgi:hypothetical protein